MYKEEPRTQNEFVFEPLQSCDLVMNERELTDEHPYSYENVVESLFGVRQRSFEDCLQQFCNVKTQPLSPHSQSIHIFGECEQSHPFDDDYLVRESRYSNDYPDYNSTVPKRTLMFLPHRLH
jgi:hypothetical protein